MKLRSPGKLWWGVTWLLQILLRFDRVSRVWISVASTRKLGRGYGAWVVPREVLRPGAVVYSAGVGTDTTFDEALIQTCGLDVHAFDPTPCAIEHARDVQKRLPAFLFHPVGIWSQDTTLTFYAPEAPGYVSHSITGIHGNRPGFSAECKRLSTLMHDLGHTQIDLLKIDIEGAEYEVLGDLLASHVHPRAICVEFDETHTPSDAGWKTRIREAVRALRAAGYRLVNVCPKGNYTFLRSEPPARPE